MLTRLLEAPVYIISPVLLDSWAMGRELYAHTESTQLQIRPIRKYTLFIAVAGNAGE